MVRKNRKKITFGYYELPRDSYVLPMLGGSWIRRSEHENPELHYHNLLEIGYCCQGEGEVILEKGVYPYFPETFTIIPRSSPHATLLGGNEKSQWDYLFVDVEKFLGDLYPGRSRFVEETTRRINQNSYFLTHSANPVLGDLVQGMIQEMWGKQEFYQESVKGYLRAFLMILARMAGKEGTALLPKEAERFQTVQIKEEGRKVDEAVRYVKEHYREQIRTEDMARVCGLSESHFRRLFAKSVQCSPMEYVNKVRIRAACELIENTGSSFEEIAVQTGFISMSTFGRNFQKFLGMSPQCWKKEGSVQIQNLYERAVHEKGKNKNAQNI